MRGRNFNGLGSLSGHASSMITSLRNNFRKKSFDYFENEKNGHVSGELHFDKKASKEQLEEIKQRIKKENKKALIKKIIVLSILAGILIYFFGFHTY